MIFTIVQISKSLDGIKEIPVREFEEKAQAVTFLKKLAYKQKWTFKKGVNIDRYLDREGRIYYVTDREVQTP